MKDGNHMVENASAFQQPFSGECIAELGGNRRILVECHRGMIQYSDSCICIRVKFGMLEIFGQSLGVSYMTRERVLICGLIREIKLIPKGECP